MTDSHRFIVWERFEGQDWHPTYGPMSLEDACWISGYSDGECRILREGMEPS